MSNKYVKLENLDPEQINCYYGGNCRIEDVQDWINDLPVEEGLEKVVHCSECVFSEAKKNGKCTCLKTNTMHKDSYYCADGLSHDMLPYWKKVNLGEDIKTEYYRCPKCRNTYHHPYQKCPACFSPLRDPNTKGE